MQNTNGMQPMNGNQRPTGRLDPLLIDAAAVAAILSVSKRTVERMHADGELPACVRIGKTGVRWRLSDIREWVDQLDRTT